MRRSLLALGSAALVLGCNRGPDEEEVVCPDGTVLTWTPYDGPDDDIEILYDDLGTPHVYADSDADLYYGSGYALARARLFQLDTLRRTAIGTRAEVQGPDWLSSDQQARAMGFARHGCLAGPAFVEAHPDEAELFFAWVSGVNRFVDEVRAGQAELPWGFGPDELDYLPEPFSPADFAAIGKRYQFGFSFTFISDVIYTLVLALGADPTTFPGFQPGAPRFIVVDEVPERPHPPDPEPATRQGEPRPAEVERLGAALVDLHANHGWGGSNNWAIHGRNTTSGRPLLANDPHAELLDPGTVFSLHLDSTGGGGDYQAAGLSFVGLPGVQLGHNAHVAWAATTTQADVMDLWDVDIGGDVAHLGSGDARIDWVDEVIPVRGEQDSTMRVGWVDGAGVLLPDEVLPVPPSFLVRDHLLFGWTGFGPTEELVEYFDIQRAGDLDAFEGAVANERVGMMNWVSASAEGIRYRVHGDVPDRGPVGSRAPACGVMDGSNPDHLWTRGLVDADDLPHLDGSQEFIVTANNDPFGNTADNDPLDDEIYYGCFFSPGYRADRAHRLLEAAIDDGPVDVEDMLPIQLDTFSGVADGLLPHLAEAIEAIGTDPDLAAWVGRDDLVAAAAELEVWDRHMDADSSEAALFRVVQALAAREILDDDLPMVFDAFEAAAPQIIAKIMVLSYAEDNQAMLDGEGRIALVQALDEALAWVDARATALGVDELTWGDLHRASFASSWGDPWEPVVGGDSVSLNVSGCSMWDEGSLRETCTTTLGPVFRQVTGFDADGRPRMVFHVGRGNDGDGARWVDGSYVQMPFSRDEVEERAVEQLIIEAR